MEPETETTEYRVVLWEQPVVPGIDRVKVGWGELTVDLVDAGGVHEVIEWAEAQLAAGAGPYSKSARRAIADRELLDGTRPAPRTHQI